MSNTNPLKVGNETLHPQVTVAAMLGCTVRTLESWRQMRTGPAWTKIGHRVFYRQEALEAWIRDQEHTPVAARAA